MNNQNNGLALIFSGIAVLLAAIGLFIMLSFHIPTQTQNYGGVTNYDELDATALKVGGTNGTRIGPFIIGSGALIGRNYTNLAASSSLVYDIAVPGVVSGDFVEASFATSTSNGAGWLVTQTSASTTAGFITINIVNNTGTAATIPASIASTTEYQVAHPVTSVPGL